MNCPNGHGPLSITERQGVEIDYCQQCRGIWLDRGEVDKIIDREIAAYGPRSEMRQEAPAQPEPFYRDERVPQRDSRRSEEGRSYYRDDERYRYGGDDDERHDRERYGKKRKRESFLKELLDFG